MTALSAIGGRGTAEEPAASELPRLLYTSADGCAAPVLAAHLSRFGPLPPVVSRRQARQWLLDEVDAAGLRGRGGAGFPAATKMRAVLGRRKSPVVVANGAEGEPLSRKDATLLTVAPHLVLDGAMLAAGATGASQVIVAVNSELAGPLEALDLAIAEREDRRYDPLPVEVVTPPDRFVAGEESALVHWLNGGPAKPTLIPPRPFERGVGGSPTLVHNVETLAHIALIARYGAGWFRALGDAGDPGSTLITMGGAVARPAVYEIARGMGLDRLLFEAGVEASAQAVLIGGFFGSWIDAPAVGRARLSSPGTASVRAALGAGVVFALPERACGLRETARIVGYLAGESAGQCGPCVNGLGAVAGAMARIARPGHDKRTTTDLRRWLGQVVGRGACHHPDGVVRLVESALRVFGEEVSRHRSGRCVAEGIRPVVPVPGEPLSEWR